ncbi:hypothetical protein PFLUV_G00250410, partial [Perca fluviatilis]
MRARSRWRSQAAAVQSVESSFQTSPCQSVVAMCRSRTSPRETVGLTTWRSASAGDAVCPGQMSSWRSPTSSQFASAVVTVWTLTTQSVSSAFSVRVERASPSSCPSYTAANAPAAKVGKN